MPRTSFRAALTLSVIGLVFGACNADAPLALDGPVAAVAQASIPSTTAPPPPGPSTDGFPLVATAMVATRSRHTASLLANGNVLAVGGSDGAAALTSAEIHDAQNDTWTATAPLSQAREQHAAVVLANGNVLVIGGIAASAAIASAELYDPSIGTWTPAAPMAVGRAGHTASVLPDGRVLVVGGTDGATALASAEIYDPQTNTWAFIAVPAHARARHTATVVPGSRVLVVGGADASGPLASAELYDAITDHWSPVAPLTQARSRHAATLLVDGSILITGGASLGGPIASVERYSPSSSTWALEGSMATARADHAAVLGPLGRVLVVDGTGAGGPLASAELFEPTISAYNKTNGKSHNAWSPVAPPSVARAEHTATVLPSGGLLLAGGAAQASSEIFDDTPAPLGTPCGSTAQCASGFCNDGVCCNVDCPSSDSCEHCDAAGICQLAVFPQDFCNIYNTAQTCLTGQGQCNSGHCDITMLTSQDYSCQASDECYVPVCDPIAHGCAYVFIQANGVKNFQFTGTTCIAGSKYANNTLVPAPLGGDCSQGSDCQSGNCTGTMCTEPCAGGHCWSMAGGVMMYQSFTGTTRARLDHVTVTLPDGDVLMIGGEDQFSPPFKGLMTRTVDILARFHPATNTWAASQPGNARTAHFGILLPNGKVFLGGGLVEAADPLFKRIWAPTGTTWTYDPTANTAVAGPTMHAARFHAAVTLLPSGVVLVAGGDGSPPPQTAEIYDPQTATWTLTAPTASAHADAAMVLLPSGEAMMIGGLAGATATAIAERYSAPINAWVPVAPLPAPRAQHTATVLPSGEVLVVGGIDVNGAAQTSAYL
ncbi:MAG: kelch repeat-containing protein, partial [Byssovorax sp.]